MLVGSHAVPSCPARNTECSDRSSPLSRRSTAASPLPPTPTRSSVALASRSCRPPARSRPCASPGPARRSARCRVAWRLGRDRRLLRFDPLRAGEQERVRDACQHRADKRRDDEQPQLLERPVADEDRRPDAPRRVDRRVVDRDADEVDQVSTRPIGMPANATFAIRSVAASTVKTRSG